MAEDDQAGGDGKDQGLEVFYRVVAGSSHVGRVEEAEYIFGRLWEFPKLQRGAKEFD